MTSARSTSADIAGVEPVATPDGKPTPLATLNTGAPLELASARPGAWKRLARMYAKLNLVLAGMYTGVGCSGTPHSHHTYSKQGSTLKHKRAQGEPDSPP